MCWLMLLRLRRLSAAPSPQTERIAAYAPDLLQNEALRKLLLSAVLLDTGNLTGASVRVLRRLPGPKHMLTHAPFVAGPPDGA